MKLLHSRRQVSQAVPLGGLSSGISKSPRANPQRLKETGKLLWGEIAVLNWTRFLKSAKDHSSCESVSATVHDHLVNCQKEIDPFL